MHALKLCFKVDAIFADFNISGKQIRFSADAISNVGNGQLLQHLCGRFLIRIDGGILHHTVLEEAHLGF